MWCPAFRWSDRLGVAVLGGWVGWWVVGLGGWVRCWVAGWLGVVSGVGLVVWRATKQHFFSFEFLVFSFFVFSFSFSLFSKR